MKAYTTDRLDLRCCDCMEMMRTMPDKAFDLAIVDPPYNQTFKKTFDYATGRVAENHTTSMAGISKVKVSEQMNKVPEPTYFDELLRISKNQIIWGANHFGNMPPSSCWIVWDKLNGEVGFADCELAWSSFPTAVRRYAFRWAGMLQGDMKNKEHRIHPTQKPVKLYNWLLHNYAKPGDTILDTHMGSGSIAIASHYKGFHLTACELDQDYFAAAVDRVKRETAQTELDL